MHWILLSVEKSSFGTDWDNLLPKILGVKWLCVGHPDESYDKHILRESPTGGLKLLSLYAECNQIASDLLEAYLISHGSDKRHQASLASSAYFDMELYGKHIICVLNEVEFGANLGFDLMRSYVDAILIVNENMNHKVKVVLSDELNQDLRHQIGDLCVEMGIDVMDLAG